MKVTMICKKSDKDKEVLFESLKSDQKDYEDYKLFEIKTVLDIEKFLDDENMIKLDPKFD